MDSSPPEREQRKQISVLFADVSGFTAMSEEMDPEEVRDVMNAVWERLDRAILSHGGFLDKHIGDAVMALFGVPAVHEDDAERAVRAALAMQSELRDFAAGRAGAAKGLRMRIGIHSGPVVLGTVGANAEFTAMGDAVNLASRLEHAAPVGGILVSHDVCRQVEASFDVSEPSEIEVKGKKAAVQVYEVRRSRSREFQAAARRGVVGPSAAMLGRDAELRLLAGALAAAVDGSPGPGLVTVCAAAGVGKSRLRFELERRAGALPAPALLLKGRATAQVTASPYALVRDAFAAHFDILETDSAAVARDKFERGALEFLGAGDEASWKAQLLGQLLGFEFSDSPGVRRTGGDAALLRELGLSALKAFFDALGRSRAVLFLLEDVHWADAQSLDALLALSGAGRRTRLLIVCFARPSLYERRPSWSDGAPSSTRVDLAPLSRGDTERLVEDALGGVSGLPADLRERLVEGAEGNPFYAEQLVKMLFDQGVVVAGRPPRVDPSRLAAFRVPPTLTGVLQARLDGLEPPEREALQMASVVGRIFWDRAVEAAAGREAAAARALASLGAKEMVFLREPSSILGSAEYIFKHALLHDVAYEGVLMRDRRAYHGRVAEWLVSQSGERLSERLGLVAEHFALAGEGGKAADFFGRAGERALATSAFPEAAHLYGRALEAGGPEAQAHVRARLLGRLGAALTGLSRYPEARARQEESLALARAAGAPTLAAKALNALANLSFDDAGGHEVVMMRALEAFAVASEAGDDVGVGESLATLGKTSTYLGAMTSASAIIGRSLEVRERLGDRRGRAYCHQVMGVIASYQLRHDEAAACYEKALALFREMGARSGMAATLNNLAGTNLELGRVVEARRLSDEARAIERETGNRKGEAWTLDFGAEAARRQGDLAAARRMFQEALAIALELGLVPFALILTASLARLRADEGDPAGAARLLGGVLGHPDLSLEGRKRAQEVQAVLGGVLGRAALAAGLARGAEDGWDAMVRRELAAGGNIQGEGVSIP